MMTHVHGGALGALVLAGLLAGTTLHAGAQASTFEAARLDAARAQLHGTPPQWLEVSVNHLMEAARADLTKGPWSVMDKPDAQLAPTGDRHDFVSFSPYWWKQPDGSWLWRDGVINPDAVSRDQDGLYALYGSVDNLVMAGWLSDDDAMLSRAALDLRTWFVAPATRMNPNLRFAAGIPGKVAGRGVGLHRMRRLPEMLDITLMLAARGHLSPADDAALRTWVREFLDWATHSDLGQEERDATNNHAVYYGYTLLGCALYLDDRETVRALVEDYYRNHLLLQIEADGSMPAEMARTKPYAYTVYALTGYIRFAEAARRAGYADIYDWKAPGHGSIKDAMLAVIPYLKADRQWPKTKVPDLVRADQAIEFFRVASRVTGDPFFEQYYRNTYPDWRVPYMNIWLPPGSAEKAPAP